MVTVTVTVTSGGDQSEQVSQARFRHWNTSAACSLAHRPTGCHNLWWQVARVAARAQSCWRQRLAYVAPSWTRHVSPGLAVCGCRPFPLAVIFCGVMAASRGDVLRSLAQITALAAYEEAVQNAINSALSRLTHSIDCCIAEGVFCHNAHRLHRQLHDQPRGPVAPPSCKRPWTQRLRTSGGALCWTPTFASSFSTRSLDTRAPSAELFATHATKSSMASSSTLAAATPRQIRERTRRKSRRQSRRCVARRLRRLRPHRGVFTTWLGLSPCGLVSFSGVRTSL